MKYDSWSDYKWFIAGAAIMTSKRFWTGDGDSNKGLKTSLSRDGKVATLSYTRDNLGVNK